MADETHTVQMNPRHEISQRFTNEFMQLWSETESDEQELQLLGDIIMSASILAVMIGAETNAIDDLTKAGWKNAEIATTKIVEKIANMRG